MQEQSQFLEILDEIKDIAASQDNQLTRDEIRQYLSYMELSDDKLDAVCRYLAAAGIKVLHRQEAVKLSVPDSDELNGIIKDFLMGDAFARDRLAESKLNHVAEIAANYKKRIAADQILTMEEVIAEGNLGLLIGISVIEKNKTQYFKSSGEPDYEAVNGIINMEIVNAVKNFIDTAYEHKDWESTVLAKINLLHEATKYLAEEYGHMPSKEELSEYTRVTAKEIDDIMNHLVDL